MGMAIKTLSTRVEIILLDEQRFLQLNNVYTRVTYHNTNKKDRTTKIESIKNTLGIILIKFRLKI